LKTRRDLHLSGSPPPLSLSLFLRRRIAHISVIDRTGEINERKLRRYGGLDCVARNRREFTANADNDRRGWINNSVIIMQIIIVTAATVATDYTAP